jgi:hypothetical protein
MDYIKLSDKKDLAKLDTKSKPFTYFLKDSFYSDINKLIDNNDLLDTATDIKLFKLFHNDNLVTVLDEFKRLVKNGNIHGDNLLHYMDILINAILEQSSENKDYLNNVKDDISLMINQINNSNHLGFNSFPNLIDRIDSKLIYLNGHYAFYKKLL